MADELIPQLRRAGAVIDRWREEHVDAAATSSDAALVHRLVPIPETEVSRSRRPRGAIVGAAALLLVIAGLAMVMAGRGDDTIPIATSGGTVALVPEPLGTGRLVQVSESVIEDPLDRAVVFGPEGLAEPDRSVIVFRIEPPEGLEYADGAGERVEAADISGRVFPGLDGEVSLITERPDDGPGRALHLVGEPGVTTDELVEMASRIDPDRPLAGQDVGEQWTLVAMSETHPEGTQARRIEVELDDRSSASVTTMVGAADDLMWIVGIPGQRVAGEVRGRPGLIGTPSAGGTATWVESPGLVVWLSIEAEGVSRDEMVERLHRLADSLVPVDQAGWQEFTARADRHTGESIEPAPTTTTSNPSTTTTTEDDPPHVSLTLQDDRRFELWSTDDGDLCWRIAPDETEHCDDPRFNSGTDLGIVPRVAIDTADGTSLLVYGHLPAGFGRIEVRLLDETSQFNVPSQSIFQEADTASPGVWTAEVPPGYEPVEVRYIGDGERMVIQEEFYPAGAAWWLEEMDRREPR